MSITTKWLKFTFPIQLNCYAHCTRTQSKLYILVLCTTTQCCIDKSVDFNSIMCVCAIIEVNSLILAFNYDLNVQLF